jgi:adenylate cyclase
MVFTALGDAVNVAARLQDMTKTLGCEVVMSDDVCKTARLLTVDAAEEHTVPIRGRAEPMTVHSIADARMLSTTASEAGPVAA